MKRYTVLLLIGVLLALVALVGGAAAEPAVTSASFIPGEPNDTFAAAIPLDNGFPESYFLFATDRDYFRFNLTTATRLHVTMADYSSEALTKARLALYNAGQTLLVENVACNDPSELVIPQLAAGTYYLLAQPCAGPLDSDKPYWLNPGDIVLEWEPNPLATASPLIVNHYGTDGVFYAEGAIQPAGDYDYFRFNGVEHEVWNINVRLLDDSDPLVPAMRLLDASYSLLATSVDGEIAFELPADGVYYLGVLGTNPGGVGGYSIQGFSQLYRPRADDAEPNNTPAQAVAIDYGYRLYGDIDENNDPIDYYRFQAQAGDKIVFPETNWNTGDQRFAVVTVYDAALNVLPQNGPTEWVELPATGDYLIAFTSREGDYNDWYDIYFTLLSGDEPNDTPETAIPMVIGQSIEGNADFPCDTDWYRFEGRAGDVFSSAYPEDDWYNTLLHDADGTPLYGLTVLPADGVYFLSTPRETFEDYDVEVYCELGPYSWGAGQALWVSAAVDGLGGNAAIKAGDIVTRKTDANRWQIVFDASDVGITKNLAAVQRMSNGAILMSLAAPQNVTGLGKVMPQDIIKFVPTALGDTTAGVFEWYLDGSDVGLTTSGEKIDAIAVADPKLWISTSGGGSAPNHNGGTLKWADEDIIVFEGTAFGANSAGKWWMLLNGSDVPGLAAEDINAATGNLVSLATSFVVAGQAGTPQDVLNGEWQLAVQQLTDKKIDGLAIGPAWMP